MVRSFSNYIAETDGCSFLYCQHHLLDTVDGGVPKIRDSFDHYLSIFFFLNVISIYMIISILSNKYKEKM
jgi:hypothetical protein